MNTLCRHCKKIGFALIMISLLLLSACSSESVCFTTSDGNYQLIADESWTKDDSGVEGSLFIVSGQNIRKSILVLSYDKATYYFFNNLATYDENMTLYMALSYSNAKIKECKAVTINNYQALLTKVAYEDHDNSITAWYCSIETGFDYITVIGKTTAENEKKDLDEIESIIKSFIKKQQ